MLPSGDLFMDLGLYDSYGQRLASSGMITLIQTSLIQTTLFQKDSLYLEQELESLNVVLNISKKQLHEQNHKLMQNSVTHPLFVLFQKDSHTLYLEQELESLNVVLDIKNKQLHQQDHKLMQMDKLVSTIDTLLTHC